MCESLSTMSPRLLSLNLVASFYVAMAEVALQDLFPFGSAAFDFTFKGCDSCNIEPIELNPPFKFFGKGHER